NEEKHGGSKSCPSSCGLCDDHISRTVIGVIDLTKRCDLRCSICFASFAEPEHEGNYEPSKEEIFKMLDYLSSLDPKPPSVLFSGGEPLLRSDIEEIVQYAHKLRFMTIIATNGLRIAREPTLAARLKESGLNIVYLQFDGFDDEMYEKLRGRKLLEEKIKVIEECRKHDIEVILVPTLIRGMNNHEIGSIIKFAAKNSDIIRGVVFQPIAYTGRATDDFMFNDWTDNSFAEEVEKQTLGEIKAKDLFPLSVMTPPLMVMRRFMKKPWPLFSCSPHCGIVNWIYVANNGRLLPINRILDFEKFFQELIKLSEGIDSKGNAEILLRLFIAALRSLNWKIVRREIGIVNFFKTVLRLHISPNYRSLGSIRRRIFLLGCMAFMDRYNLDINRLRRCVIHFVTPTLDIVPFCAYNNIYRTKVEDKYAGKKPVKAQVHI
ncbi:radical SAM protein, partial [Candidatus Bathyarchaeota archaeon]|nr:radical SAM protein [Candidatus Bathyarchaeota archaeon]